MATNNNEFFDALAALEKERGLPADYLIDKIKAAIVIAVKKDYEVEDDNVVVDIDPNIGAFRASLLQDIVEEVENPHTQVSLEDAQKLNAHYRAGDILETEVTPKNFGRIAAQTAKHVIRQGLREGERSLQCSEMQSRAHEIITGTVTAVDAERGNIVLDLGKGGSAVILLLIGLGFGIFTVGTVRYLKALEVEAKKAVESAEQEKTCAEQGERTEKQKKREELDTMFSAGLISRDEYDCARKKYEE